MTHLFSPLKIREITLPNRIAASPMCSYSAENGVANDWHLVHLGGLAAGGSGLIIVEATAVSPEGRISPKDLGIWDDSHIQPLKKITDYLANLGAVPAIQLAHAGRKASVYVPNSGNEGAIPFAQGGWQPIAPSAVAFSEKYHLPRVLDKSEIPHIIELFVNATRRAQEAGFKVIEIHAAHGYLLHQFLSPLSNQRTDEYGGCFENRIRLTLEVIRAVRKALNKNYPLLVRVSATDWMEGGWDLDETIKLAQHLKNEGVDLIDTSTGGMSPNAQIPVGAGYETEFARAIRKDANIASSAVGMITAAEQADHVIRSEQADLVLLGRELLRNPFWPLQAAKKLEHPMSYPMQYLRAAPKGSFARSPLISE